MNEKKKYRTGCLIILAILAVLWLAVYGAYTIVYKMVESIA